MEKALENLTGAVNLVIEKSVELHTENEGYRARIIDLVARQENQNKELNDLQASMSAMDFFIPEELDNIRLKGTLEDLFENLARIPTEQLEALVDKYKI